MKQDEITEKLNEFALPAWNEIPDVGLYLDQVTKYVNSYLAGWPGMDLTGSMVSNYVKLKILPRATKKMYSRSLIAGIFFIATSKLVLSMDQIRKCLSEHDYFCLSEEGYELFRSELVAVIKSFNVNAAYKTDPKKSEEEKMLRTIDIALAHKMYLDQYFLEETDK